MPYEVTATREVTHRLDGRSINKWSRGPFDSLQDAMLAVAALGEEMNREMGHPFRARVVHGSPAGDANILREKREIRIVNLDTGRRVQPSQRQRRWANQHTWPSDRASWIWPRAREETEV
jgi:hypothetical protein